MIDYKKHIIVDERYELRKCLTDLSKNLPNSRLTEGELQVELLVGDMLTDRQKNQIKDNRRTVKGLKKVNSSMALIVNYYALYEHLYKSQIKEVKYERPLTVPLKNNIGLNKKWITRYDASYMMGNEICFVEGKFLEPYYHNSHDRNIEDDFLSSQNYVPEVENAGQWIRLAKHWNKFRHFDFPQMYKHLLAIYYHRMQNPKLYDGKQIKLQSIGWNMTDTFKKHYEDLKLPDIGIDWRCRRTKEEEERALGMFNEFIKSISMDKCVFEVKHYNDPEMLKAIEHSDKFEAFKRQYLLD